MACCVVAALLFGSLRRLLIRLTPGRRPDLAFAPAAHRPAPGAPLAAPAATTALPGPRPTLRPVLLGLAGGVVVYAAGIDLLAAADLMHAHTGVVRDIGLGVVVAALALWALACPPLGAARRRRGALVALAAAGVAWTATGAVEMHTTGAVGPASHTALADVAFHGGGLLVAALALAALSLAGRDHRSPADAAMTDPSHSAATPAATTTPKVSA